MDDDSTFRLMLILVAATFMPLGLCCRIRPYTGEKLDRRQAGLFNLFGQLEHQLRPH